MWLPVEFPCFYMSTHHVSSRDLLSPLPSPSAPQTHFHVVKSHPEFFVPLLSSTRAHHSTLFFL